MNIYNESMNKPKNSKSKKTLIHIFFIFYIFLFLVLRFPLADQNFNNQNNNLNIPEYLLSFKYYDYNLKSNIEYFLFDDIQQSS